MTAAVCLRRYGQGTCRAVLAPRSDAIGRVTLACPSCERTAAGLCLACPQPVAGVVGRSRFCAPCRQQARRADATRYRKRYPAKVRAASKKHASRAEVKARRAELQRLRQLADPIGWAARQRAGDRRRARARCRAGETRPRASKRPHPAPLLARWEGEYRLCSVVGCDRVLTGKKKKCTRCKEVAAQAARAALMQGGYAIRRFA